MGAVSDDYRLGVGDEIIVSIRGQRNTTQRTLVDVSGQVTVPSLPPIAAAGKTFGEFRTELERQVQEGFLQSQVYVSLGAIRQLSVLVAGEVSRPGLKTVTGVSSVIDALVAAGGIKKSGSLRRVVLVREGRETVLDLYPVLLGTAKASDISLRDGDRLVVPVLGPTVAISGDVMRPGIYELNADKLDAAAAMAWAGGGISAEGNVLSRLRVTSTGQREVTDLGSGAKLSLARGDILKVARRGGGDIGTVSLVGNVAVPGERPLARYPSVFALIRDPGVLQGASYLPFVVVITTDKVSGAQRYVAVDAAGALGGGATQAQSDFPLSSGDQVVVLSLSDVRYLSSADVQNVLRGELPVYGLVDRKKLQNQGNGLDGRSEVGDEEPLLAQYKNQRASLATAGGGKDGLNQSATANRSLLAAQLTPQQSAENGTSPLGMADTGPAASQPLDALKYCAGLRQLIANVIRRGNAVSPAGGLRPANDPAADSGAAFDIQPCPVVFDQIADLLPFVVDHASQVQGEVRNPGIYPVAQSLPANVLVNVAGGLSDAADSSHVEVTNYRVAQAGATVRQVVSYSAAAAVAVMPGDAVRVGARYSDRDAGGVMISGEVERPGLYNITRGEKLSDLIARAGGLTPQAYPIGSVFTREAVRRQEQEGYEITARELESGIGPALISISSTAAGSSAQTAAATVSAIQQLVRSLRSAKAVGRVVTETDPAILSVRPELDTVLQVGDALFVPKRPNHVSISGEVLHPGAQRFEDGLAAGDYIRNSGGFTANADDSRIYMILPSGQAKPIKSSFWNFSRENVPPGTTVVVPRDLTPFNFWAITKDLTQILSQVALSAASLAVISNN